jgi:hypothetical protein
MVTIPISGLESPLRPAEKMVPNIDWWAFLNKVAAQCVHNTKKIYIKAGYKYYDNDYWRCIVFSVMQHLNTKDGTDELNDLLWEREKTNGKRGPKVSPKPLKGKTPRFERKTPNESQINDFIRKLPKYVQKGLVQAIFKAQIDVALELGVISKDVEVYIDYTDRYYYGEDDNSTNSEIIGVHNGPGTNKARKYLGFMIGSESAKMFVGISAIIKGKKRCITIEAGIAMLQQWGFKVIRVEGDREFSTYDIIGTLQNIGVPYTGTMKKTAPIKRIVEDHFDGKCKPVVFYTLNPTQYTHHNFGPISVFLIMKTDPGMRMRDLRKQLQTGQITRAKALEHIHVFVTSETPPKQKSLLVRWGLARIQFFKKRWRIETGFRDLNRFMPTSHARANVSKLLWMSMRMFAYNAWQIQRALRKKLRNVPKVWKLTPTLRRFGMVQGRICAL